MNFNVEKGKIPGVLIFQPPVFKDDRGFFQETHHNEKYHAAGISDPFVQDNFSFSKQGVLRGLHYQDQHPQGKLVYVISGSIFDVAVDIRPDSPTFGLWEGYCLNDENRHQLFIPAGFAHGFVVLSETAAVMYKCTDIYRPEDDRGIIWNDPTIGIDWPVSAPLLSPKDADLPRLAEARPGVVRTS